MQFHFLDTCLFYENEDAKVRSHFLICYHCLYVDLSVPKNVHKCDGCDRIFDDFNELLMKVAGMFRISKTRIEIISVLHQRWFFG